MKYTLAILGIFLFGVTVFINNPKKLNAEPAKRPKIEWMEFDKAQAYMRQKPKKAYIVLYTNMSYWCKIMNRQTLSNKNVVDYINANFYAIKFNAETKEDIIFKGKTYSYDSKNQVHELAKELMKGKLSYPTSVFFEENFAKPLPVPGVLEVRDIEMILKYLGENKNKTMPWATYQSNFIPLWK